ncbi:polysaccharide export outer membrane protein [Sphingomonas guangdongensis]|uniref:Polysaccharide export outer membrane protein n=1 Tax=Sphingomonas guangdongensis TaxID=1141890 RepID=A0A285QGF5_9SPHN|nr:polysaccharide biosynthesis/export family protein [Sphingomonas guangdongensis]SOB80554.1 polysaccharide export outer membrane protein [Sphingomonas guangdongensis]
MRLTFLPILAVLSLCACGGGSGLEIGGPLPPAERGGIVTPVANQDYRLGPLDTITVRVFREPELSFDSLPVSLSGKISYPLLGELQVSGMSTLEVANRLSTLLNQRYLRNSSVSVSLERAANFTVTVDGEVRKPGVYQIPGARLSLVQAVALGEGVTEFAKLNEVLVIRESGGQRYVARFDLREIRAGRADDPQIQQSDIIVVGFSQASSLLRVAIGALPGVAGLFVALSQ